MHPAILKRLENAKKRYQELSDLLTKPDVMNDMERLKILSKERAKLEPLTRTSERYDSLIAELNEAKELQNSSDQELRELAVSEIAELMKNIEKFEMDLQIQLLPEDPNDDCNVYLEIRAGTGGDEAALFAGDLFRMYTKFAEMKGWKVEILGESESEFGGYKEVIALVSGKEVYANLKFESGAHRVQRVPETEAQGRIHTSTCTVAVFPEMEKVNSVEINPSDLRIDTYRAQGAGGQHVNKTDSAIRITHIPTGIVVACQSERSQVQNRAKAMAMLQSKMLSEIQEKQKTEQDSTRRNLVGTGKRAERIRTYNFPQGRVTDHRINLTMYNLTKLMDGDMFELIENLKREHQSDLLQSLINA